jgi:hypothetical protein
MSRGSAVGIATGYGLDDREVGVRVPVGSGIFSTGPDQLWGPPNFLCNGSWVVKRPRREADVSPPTTSLIRHNGVVHKGNFAF